MEGYNGKNLLFALLITTSFILAALPSMLADHDNEENEYVLAGDISCDYTLHLHANEGTLRKSSSSGEDVTAAMAAAGAVVSGVEGAWVLTLTNFNFTTSDSGSTLFLPSGSTIVLNGTNSINNTSNTLFGAHGVSAGNGDLAITSTAGGSLTTTGGNPTASFSYGIIAKNLTIGGNATVIATGGNAPSISAGINVSGDLTVKDNAKVTANGGTSTEANSCGIYMFGDLFINDNATVIAIGGSGVNSYSINIIHGITYVPYVVPSGYEYWKNDDATETGAEGPFTGNGSATVERTSKYVRITAVYSAPATVSVTNITGVPTTGTVGTAVTLTGTVNPGDATNKTIVWSIISGGTATGASMIGGNQLAVTGAGTVLVKATITNGTTVGNDYTEQFTVTFTAATETDTTVGDDDGISMTIIAVVAIAAIAAIGAAVWFFFLRRP